MNWPRHAVETVRPSRFRPPFCPHPDCRAHRDLPPRFHRHGHYRRRSDPRRIPRFRCARCRHTCSRQTFAFSYHLKRRDLPLQVAPALQAGSAHRQIARSLACAKTSVTRLANRLSDHARLFHRLALSRIPDLREPVVHDHFEAFVGRQDRALAIGTPIGARSWFALEPDPAPHRGHGRRPERKEAPPRDEERSPYIRSIRRTLDSLAPLVPQGEQLTLVVDGRKDYPIALRSHPEAHRFRLEVYPNPVRGPKGSPRSAEAIARDRAMAPVDHLHQLLRHTCADHKRETIAFGRKVESIVGRAYLTTLWRNFIKGRSERRPDRRTPAMLLGLTDRPWTWRRVLARRLFATRG